MVPITCLKHLLNWRAPCIDSQILILALFGVPTFCDEIVWTINVVCTYTCRTSTAMFDTCFNVWIGDIYCTVLWIHSLKLNSSSNILKAKYHVHQRLWEVYSSIILSPTISFPTVYWCVFDTLIPHTKTVFSATSSVILTFRVYTLKYITFCLYILFTSYH